MDPLHAGLLGVTGPPIPESGLREVLGQWIGRGELFEGLAFPDEDGHSSWSAADIEARAHRVLLERLKPLAARLPARADAWAEFLPAVRQHETASSSAPTSGTDWPATRIRFGWPPGEFIGRRSERRADSLLSTTLRWTLETLAEVRSKAVAAYPEADIGVRKQIDAGCGAASRQPLASAPPIRPGRHDLMALRRAGRPWGTIADIAGELAVLDASPLVLAAELLAPDDAIRWRLFHLGVLGEVLQAARGTGSTVHSCGPLRPAGGRPSFEIRDRTGCSWTFGSREEASGRQSACVLLTPKPPRASRSRSAHWAPTCSSLAKEAHSLS